MVGWEMNAYVSSTLLLLEPKNLFILGIGVLITTMPQRWFQRGTVFLARRPLLQSGAILSLFLLALMTLIDSGFTPFIYANF
jgi:hypothetical protein